MNRTSTSAPPPARTSVDALAPLTFLGWRRGLLAIVLSLAASFFLFGYALVYWRNADMDFMVIYNAFVLNDGKPQHFFDHTGYLTIVAVNRELAPAAMHEAFEAYIARSLAEEIDRIEAYYADKQGAFFVAEDGATLAGMFGLEGLGTASAELRHM